MAAGDRIVSYGTPKQLMAAGGAIAAGALAQATTANYSVATDGGGYADVEFVLLVTFDAAAPTEGSLLSLLARPLDIIGTSDTPVPEVTRPTRILGLFEVDNVTTQQALLMRGDFAEDVPYLFAAYLRNDTSVAISAWELWAKPRTYRISAA